MSKLLSILMISLCFSFLFYSDVNAITDEEVFRNFRFTFVNPGARSSAMGGAFIGLADDATAAEANPAGLTILIKPEVSVEYRNIETDPDEFDDFASTDISVVPSFSILTDFEAEDLNRASFLGVVFPSGGNTYAFSRQEAVNLEMQIFNLQGFNLAGVEPFDIFIAGTQNLRVDNYNFSVASKVGGNFKVGGSLRYSRLDWQESTQNFFANIAGEPLFITSLDATDSAFAWNVGALADFGPHASVGFVYKKNAKFEVEEQQTVTELGSIVFPGVPNATFTNVLKIPDSFGFGIAIKPNDNVTFTSDLVRIEYSDLLDDFVVGKSVLGIIVALDDDDVNFVVDDQWEYHLGAEFTVPMKNVVLALRGGYYRQPFASVVAESAPGLSAFGAEVYGLLYPEPDVVNHFTWGAGAVFGTHFQIDFALDTSNESDTFVLSSVVRF